MERMESAGQGSCWPLGSYSTPQAPDSPLGISSPLCPPPSALNQSPNSNTVTNGMRIEAAAELMPKESQPDRGRFFFRYRIRVTNEGERSAKLISRKWLILDANNHSEEVEGDGVVGKQPHLKPGELFEYESICPLRTEWGTMEGSYTFLTDEAETFEAAVGRFFLVPTVIGASDGD